MSKCLIRIRALVNRLRLAEVGEIEGYGVEVDE